MSNSTLSELGFDAAEAVDVISEVRTDLMLYITMLVLLIYDTLLTFSQELRCIWKRKWTGATLIYITIRYANMVDFASQVWADATIPKQVELCSFTHYSGLGFNILVFESLRVWAISGKNWTLAMLVMTFGLLAPGFDIDNEDSQNWPECVSQYKIYFSFALQCLLLILNILNIIFDLTGITTEAIDISQLITVNSGLILSLRAVHLEQDGSGSTQSSINFSASVVGNLGAPVRSDGLSFNSAELDDILEDEETAYSDNPLGAPNLDQPHEVEVEMQNLGEDGHILNQHHESETITITSAV
ncbi:hypothetical protein K474DRAFT_1673466 [Panus rudis PR-1116 ss-1]|nr:hypothetical protein K474DRAFT_1673466 [Panus rudis PR-1116 ss-1]